MGPVSTGKGRRILEKSCSGFREDLFSELRQSFPESKHGFPKPCTARLSNATIYASNAKGSDLFTLFLHFMYIVYKIVSNIIYHNVFNTCRASIFNTATRQ